MHSIPFPNMPSHSFYVSTPLLIWIMYSTSCYCIIVICFKGVHTVISCVALSEYTQKCVHHMLLWGRYTDGGGIRMYEGRATCTRDWTCSIRLSIVDNYQSAYHLAHEQEGPLWGEDEGDRPQSLLPNYAFCSRHSSLKTLFNAWSEGSFILEWYWM